MVSYCLAQFMLKKTYWEGIVLRMINKDSLNKKQNDKNGFKSHRSEYQTFRLFAILGAMTLIFVLIIRFAQNGPGSIQQRMPTNSIGTTEVKK